VVYIRNSEGEVIGKVGGKWDFEHRRISTITRIIIRGGNFELIITCCSQEIKCSQKLMMMQKISDLFLKLIRPRNPFPND
jgi:hypothetical protein